MPACTDPTPFGRCRKCAACIRTHQSSWVLRMLLESMAYPETHVSFLTLTYNQDSLPVNERAAKISFQKFMKRLRCHWPPGVRYVAGLETGTQGTCRYHWHAVIYGFPFSVHSRSLLEKLWPNGFIKYELGTPRTMHYVTKYAIKGRRLLMSRNPGIGGDMIPSLQKMLNSLSDAELAKLRGPHTAMVYGHKPERLRRLAVGRFTYPLHEYLKRRLQVPATSSEYALYRELFSYGSS